MSEALGGQLFVKELFTDGDIVYGQVQSTGPVAIKFSTFKICDLVTYNKGDIYKTDMFNAEIVDVILYEYVDYDRED